MTTVQENCYLRPSWSCLAQRAPYARQWCVQCTSGMRATERANRLNKKAEWLLVSFINQSRAGLQYPIKTVSATVWSVLLLRLYLEDARFTVWTYHDSFRWILSLLDATTHGCNYVHLNLTLASNIELASNVEPPLHCHNLLAASRQHTAGRETFGVYSGTGKHIYWWWQHHACQGAEHWYIATAQFSSRWTRPQSAVLGRFLKSSRSRYLLPIRT